MPAPKPNNLSRQSCGLSLDNPSTQKPNLPEHQTVCSISIWYLFARNSIPNDKLTNWRVHCVSIRRQFDFRVVNFSLNFWNCRVLSINKGIFGRPRPIAHEPVPFSPLNRCCQRGQKPVLPIIIPYCHLKSLNIFLIYKLLISSG